METCWRYPLVSGLAGLRSAAALHPRAAEPTLLHFATPKAPQSTGKPPARGVLQSNADSCNASSFFSPPFPFSPHAEVRGKWLTLAACDGSGSASGLQLHCAATQHPGDEQGRRGRHPTVAFACVSLPCVSLRVVLLGTRASSCSGSIALSRTVCTRKCGSNRIAALSLNAFHFYSPLRCNRSWSCLEECLQCRKGKRMENSPLKATAQSHLALFLITPCVTDC